MSRQLISGAFLVPLVIVSLACMSLIENQIDLFRIPLMIGLMIAMAFYVFNKLLDMLVADIESNAQAQAKEKYQHKAESFNESLANVE